MNFETKAARVAQLDAQINLFRSRDPHFVEHQLVPRRMRAWQAFRGEFSACSSSDCWQFVGLIMRSAP